MASEGVLQGTGSVVTVVLLVHFLTKVVATATTIEVLQAVRSWGTAGVALGEFCRAWGRWHGFRVDDYFVDASPVAWTDGNCDS